MPYEHFFRPPGEVSLFCPDGHLPDGFVCGLPLPGPTVIAAAATPVDAASANTDTSSAMRFFIGQTSLSMTLPPFYSMPSRRRKPPRVATTVCTGFRVDP